MLPAGVDLEQFRPIDRAEARRRLGEPGNRAPWVLFSSAAGQRNPVKRARLARAAFDVVRDHYPDAELKLLVDRPHEKVPLWINACNVVLLTSTREGWPNIIKESLACNVPFVSTDVSDLAAIAAVEPRCTVAEATPEALSRGLLAALRSDETSDLRRHVLAMEVGVIANRLKSLYERICPS